MFFFFRSATCRRICTRWWARKKSHTVYTKGYYFRVSIFKSYRNDIWHNEKQVGYIIDSDGLRIGEVTGFEYNPKRYLVDKDNDGNIRSGIVSYNNFIEYLDLEEVEKYFKKNYQEYEIEHFIPFSKILN